MAADSKVDYESPWLGLHSFTPATKQFFFGRQSESEELLARVCHKILTVLFGQSGLGKTSLIGAGLIPQLEANGYAPIRLKIGYDQSDLSPECQVMEALTAVLPKQLKHPPDSLWLLFHDPDYGLLEPTAPKIVLILDQFEEIFTLGEYPARRASSAVFRDLLSDIIENRVPSNLRQRIEADDSLSERLDYSARSVKFLLSLREDYLHALERWRPTLPSLMDNRFELRSLSGQQALAAVLGPAALRCQANQSGMEPIVSRDTAEKIVRFVAGVNDNIPISHIEAVPPLLSLISQQLNTKRPSDEDGRPAPGTTFDTEHLAGKAATILADFYRSCFTGIPDEAVRDAVRQVIEEKLVSNAGIRESLSWKGACREIVTLCGEGADAEGALRHLIDERLLVVEERRETRVQSQHLQDTRKLELTHDILVDPVQASRDERRKRRANRSSELAGQSGLVVHAHQHSSVISSGTTQSGPIGTKKRKKYPAFLNYRHSDNREVGRQWANWIHHALETFDIPPDIVGTANHRGDLVPPSIYPVFRDEVELPASADLSLSIQQALDDSETQIVLCSPGAAASAWVNAEIRFFKESGRGDQILAVIIDGEPNAGDRGKAELGITPEME